MDKGNRKDVLLRAAYDLLRQQEDSHYVLNLLEEVVEYDNCACDGCCLMNDICWELYEDEHPPEEN